MNYRKTIAIQVSDPEFVERYEARVAGSGKSVKNYHIGLIEFDVAYGDHPLVELVRDAELTEKLRERAERSGQSLKQFLLGLMEQSPAQPAAAQEQPPLSESGQETAAEQNRDREQAPAPAQDAKITNLFVKITRELRDALEARKNETGETVGATINRLVSNFMEDVRNDRFEEGFEETYRQYQDAADACTATCSSKIPTALNQELFAYLEKTGKSRNVLMATLVHYEIHSPRLTEEQAQGMGMAMTQ